MMHSSWTYLSYFGDLAVLLPCMIVFTAWVAFCVRRLLARWLMSLLGVALVVTLTKLLYMAWGIGIPSLNFIGVSGHSAFAALIWPVVFAVSWDWQDRLKGTVLALLGFVLAFAIGFSRFQLKVHSMAEVCAGLLLGLIASVFFLAGIRKANPSRPSRLGLLLLITLAMLPGYGMRFPSEYLLKLVAQHMSLTGHVHTRQWLPPSG